MSRSQASSVGTSTTRTESGSAARARSSWAAETAIVTGSEAAIALATAAKAACAGAAPSRQLSGRSGQAIQQPAWGSHSAGMWKPSAAGVLSSASAIPGIVADRSDHLQSEVWRSYV